MRMAKSSIESEDLAPYEYQMAPSLAKSQSSNGLHIVRKYTYSHADASKAAPGVIEDFDEYSQDISNSEEREDEKILEEESYDPSFEELARKDTFSLLDQTEPSNEVKSLQTKSFEPELQMCPMESTVTRVKEGLNASKSLNTSKSQTSETKELYEEDGATVEVFTTTTVTKTLLKTTEFQNESNQSIRCIYDSLTDESSQNPSPELGVTLESVSDDQFERPNPTFPDDEEVDRKDSNTSNTSNMTNISTLTTDSNFSAISVTSDASELSSCPFKKENNVMKSRRKSCADQFSLIENYPPRERRKLHNEIEQNSAGSDTSASGPSPPLVRPPPSAARYRPPPSAKLSRQNSIAELVEARHHKHTVSLSHLEDARKSSAKPNRAAITP